MSKKKNFTKEQKHLIKQCMIDADIMGLGKETIVYVKSRLGLVDDDGSSNNKKGSEKSYEEILEEIKSRVELLAADYIPELCTALKRKNPLITSAQIRLKILNHPTIKRVWKGSTIRMCWADWMKNPERRSRTY